MTIDELPQAVLNMRCMDGKHEDIYSALHDEVGSEKLLGVDLEFDESMVWDGPESEEPDWDMATVDRFVVWTDSKILIWNSGWRYFTVISRNPDARVPFRIKGEL